MHVLASVMRQPWAERTLWRRGCNPASRRHRAHLFEKVLEVHPVDFKWQIGHEAPIGSNEAPPSSSSASSTSAAPFTQASGRTPAAAEAPRVPLPPATATAASAASGRRPTAALLEARPVIPVAGGGWGVAEATATVVRPVVPVVPSTAVSRTRERRQRPRRAAPIPTPCAIRVACRSALWRWYLR